MKMSISWRVGVSIMALIAGAMEANAGSLTYSHHSTALPDAAGPAITMLSITGTNDGTSLTFIITFANPTIEGPSSASDDAVYGFVNLDTDNDAGTGVSGSFLDTNGLQPGFGQYSPAAHGIDAYINLTSEGDPLHGAPGLVDLVSTSTFTPIATLPVLYVDGGGNTPSTLTFSIALSILADNQIPLGDTGDFSVIVGNLNNATDFLPSSVIPEPSSLGLFGLGLVSSLLLGRRLRR